MKTKRGSAEPLGATVEKHGVNFSVAAPKEATCELWLYNPGSEKSSYVFELEENPLTGNIRSIYLCDSNLAGMEYLYRINGQWTQDPYAREIVCNRAKILEPSYDWEEDLPLQLPDEQVIAYSLHVRGFTRHASSKVKGKGTFTGVMEKLPYLTELGITQIQLMPMYEFEDGKGYTNYWGYGSGFFFAPKSRYAQKDAVTEWKDLVKACHRAGIEVVCYLPFDGERSVTYMLSCLKYYRKEYHVDGFILNPYVLPLHMVLEDPFFAGIKLYEKTDEFQVIMRRFLKGDEGMVSSVIEQLRRLPQHAHTFHTMTDHTGFTMQDLVSYDGKHNEKNGEQNQDGPEYNYSWNCGVEGPTRKRDVVRLRRRQMKNAWCLLLLSQGMPCILAGDEFANSQNGNNNVYCQDNEISWLNWNQTKTEQDLLRFVKDLIAFRKEHDTFHPKEAYSGIDRTGCGTPDVSYHGENAWQVPNGIASRQLGVYYSGGTEKMPMFVAYNMHWEDHVFALPTLKKGWQWKKIMDTEAGFHEGQLQKKRTVTIPARTIAILVGTNTEEHA